MKYLLWADAVLTAIGGVMMLAIGFVALIYGLYSDLSPVMHGGLHGILIITACFTILFLLAASATVGIRRSRGWHWPLQALLAISLPLLWTVISAQLRSP